MTLSFRFAFLALLSHISTSTTIQVASALRGIHPTEAIESLGEPEPGSLSIQSMSKTSKAITGAVAGAILGNRTGGGPAAALGALAGFGIGADSANRWEADQAKPPWERTSMVKHLGAIVGAILAEEEDLGIAGMLLGGFGGYSMGSEADKSFLKGMEEKWLGLVSASAAVTISAEEEASVLGSVMAGLAGWNAGVHFQDDLTSYTERTIAEILGAIAGAVKGSQANGWEGGKLGIPIGFFIGRESAGLLRKPHVTAADVLGTYLSFLAIGNSTDYSQEPNLWPNYRQHLEFADDLLGVQTGLILGNATKNMFKPEGPRDWAAAAGAIGGAEVFLEKQRSGQLPGLNNNQAVQLGALAGYALYLKVREIYIQDRLPPLPKGVPVSPRDDAHWPSEAVVKHKRSAMRHPRKHGLKIRKQHP